MSSKLGFLLNYNEDSLNLVPSKAQKRVPLTKKQKKLAKKAEYEAKKQGKVSKSASEPAQEEDEADAIEHIERRAFTPGWEKSFTVKEALPIKTKGKIIRTLREVAVDEESEDDEEESGALVSSKLSSKPKNMAAFKPLSGNDSDIEKSDGDDDDADSANNSDDDGSSSEMDVVDSDDDEDEGLSKKRKLVVAEDGNKKSKGQKGQKEGTTTEEPNQSDDDDKPKKPKVSASQRMLAAVNINNAKRMIGEICTAITADPERCFRKRRDVATATDLTEEEPTYNVADLLALLQHTDHRVVELAMLSALLVFKDVIPGYRIRPPSESELNVQLKKETKRMRDFEQCLLASYQKYLKFLDSKVTSGLKNPRKEVSEWDLIAKLGLSALRCFCELLRAVPHFNYRTMLLTAVVTRAAQPSEQVYSLCCETLIHVFKSDVEAEVSYETVKLISKILAVAKYDVPEALLRCLETVKLRVHADEAKTIRRKAKSERRKRRRDENEAELLESNPVADKSTSMRFQADSLHEICLIYFRIVKMKVGFTLLPVALEGLGRITHLINIDTVGDLMALLSNVIKHNPPPPPLVQLHCIHCALKTLSGPGQELKLDDEVYISSLRDLMKDLSVDFIRWDIILECLDLCLSKRREPRSNVVVSFVRLLLVNACHMLTTQAATALLAAANMILLKYPRVRMDMLAFTTTAPGATTTLQQRLNREEDEVGDMAMKALRDSESSSSSHAHSEAADGDGSWLLPLLRTHIDKHTHRVIMSLVSKEVASIPIRMNDAKVDLDSVMGKLDTAFSTLPSPFQRHGSTNTGKTGSSASAKMPGSMHKPNNKNQNQRPPNNGGNKQKHHQNSQPSKPNGQQNKCAKKEFQEANKSLKGTKSNKSFSPGKKPSGQHNHNSPKAQNHSKNFGSAKGNKGVSRPAAGGGHSKGSFAGNANKRQKVA